LDSADWGPPYEAAGFPSGIQKALIVVDPSSGGETYYARFPAGSTFDLHWHSHPEYVAILAGEVTLTLGEQRYAMEAGSYVAVPANMNHAWEVDGELDCVLLVRRTGPADFNFVEPD
jgi:quercetin dioxygenase-like cupin family protein